MNVNSYIFPFFTGMDCRNEKIHGQMVLNILHNVPSTQKVSSLMKLNLRMKKELYGGMHIVTGYVPQYMAQLLLNLLREQLIHLTSQQTIS